MKKLFFFLITFVLSVPVVAQTGHFYSSDLFSSSLISSVCQDRQGSLWIATDYGLNKFDGYHFGTYLHSESDTTSLVANVVVTLFCDSRNRLWVGTNRGLDRYDSDHESFVHYRFPNDVKPRVTAIQEMADGRLLIGTAGYGIYALGKDNRLTDITLDNQNHFFSRLYIDSQQRIWRGGFNDEVIMRQNDRLERFPSPYGTPQAFVENGGSLYVLCQHGLLCYRDGRMQPADVDLSAVADKEVVFTTMQINDKGIIYIGTRGKGFYRLSDDQPRRRLEPVSISAAGINPNTAYVSAIFCDNRGNLWLGCHRKGLLMVPLKPAQFNTWSFSAQGINLASVISSVCEGDGGMTWCAVQGVGVYGFDADGHVVARPATPEGVEFIFRDQQQRYWVGTDDGLFAYDPLTGRSQLKVTFECDRFNDMTSDAYGRIYISAFSRGFCVYDPATGVLQNYNMHQTDTLGRGRLCNNWIMGLSSDREGLIWLATASGVGCFDSRTGRFNSQGWDVLLDGKVCFDVCELKSGQLPDGRQLSGCIAIGTELGLYLYDRRTRQVERFPGSEMLDNKAISYIVQSDDGDLWCSTSLGIWQYAVTTHRFMGHVNGNGLTQKEYLYGVGLHTNDDRVAFGHSEGLTVFTPRQVKDQRPMLDSLQLSAFVVGNTTVKAGTELNGVVVTDCAVSRSNFFTLSYLDHTMMLAFSQFNFDSPMNVTFEHRINGSEWVVNPEGENSFTLSHLQPGTYRIEVRAQVGGEYTPTKVLIVTIRAPWYRSLPAYFVYFALIVSLLVYVYVTYRRRAAEQMNEEKMKFLINATHDIRSPLTLIMGAVKKLKQPATGSDGGGALDAIERNSQRILNLVNQILDVRKIDKQQMHLHCQATDLVSFTRSICKMYEYNAREHHVEFFFEPKAESIEAWVDRKQFDKVISNLLSNAFKYNSDKGAVHVSLACDDRSVILQVSDHGQGLDAESLHHVFDRFYQGGNSRQLNTEGTGIGLNLCKMIVDMHHGTITAQNRTDGETGAVFTVTLPLGNAHLKAEEIETSQPLADEPSVTAQPSAAVTASRPFVSSSSSSSKPRVLIVDDDEEIGHYISTELAHYYKFTLCSNGKEGLKELLARIADGRSHGDRNYDLVISDVMMPEMDGFTMLRMIKTNLNISDIPVVMLTSKADVGNRLEGLERGADAFLAKPFDMDELHSVIDNLLRNRQRLKGKYSGAQQQADKIEQPEVKGNDELLMERIMKAINKNLSDSDFNVDMLTQEVGISRAQLHRKMKEMTGISTSEFIRNIRLEQAARLLKEQKINVTQVAYTVGFSNLAHFSTIFRKHFGVSPSEYVEREQ